MSSSFAWWRKSPKWLIRLGYTPSMFPPWRIVWNAIWFPLLVAAAVLMVVYGFAVGGPHHARRYWSEAFQ